MKRKGVVDLSHLPVGTDIEKLLEGGGCFIGSTDGWDSKWCMECINQNRCDDLDKVMVKNRDNTDYKKKPPVCFSKKEV